MSLEKYTNLANNIKFEKRAFINGEFTNSKSSTFFESVIPANCNVNDARIFPDFTTTNPP